MKDGDLIIKFLGGIGKLSYEIKHYQDMLCSCFVIVDNDEASKSIVPKLLESTELNNDSCSYLVAKGKKETEIENLFKIEIYSNKIDEEFGIDFKNTKFGKDTSKWSIALRNVLEAQGKVLTDSVLNVLKKYIATQVSQHGVYENIHDCNHEYVNNLIIQLERKFIK